MKPTTTMLTIDTPTTFLAEAAPAAAVPFHSTAAGALRRNGIDPAFARRPVR